MSAPSRPALLSRPGRLAAGLTLLATIGIELGGKYVLDISLGEIPRTDFQLLYARSGHGHAGALATLGIASIVLTDAAGLKGLPAQMGRWAIPASAVLMPAGFFLSSSTPVATEPNAMSALITVGGFLLGAALVVVGGTLAVHGVRGPRSEN
ncbi:hypothetical protein Bequi_05780 [Brachybacterium sp. JHP9]|uniref:Uncharacterized protein n=1 Tax=Brachybacterium equifaecis TaxID=2910770 RepID=A0ABT0QZB2_9MICO|nr:hypothetical protein [Brachybacterium equifaecis]MCL6422900.1 hypothetical protein [Brachybacterium equifaecis]